MKAQTLVETNPIADWLDYNIIYEEGCRTNIGVAQRDKDPGSDNWYLNTEKWLYPNYTEYCHNTGSRPIGLRRFVNLLSDVCLNQLGCQVEKGRDRSGSYFLGLKIRGDGDEDAPLFVTGLSDRLLQEVREKGKGEGEKECINNLSPFPLNLSPIQDQGLSDLCKNPDTTGNTGAVMDSVMDSVTNSVKVDSIASDECYGCNDKTYNLLNVETQLAQIEQYTTAMERELEEKENLDKKPSPALLEQAQSIEGDELEVNSPTAKEPSPTVTNDENQGLKVGDKVRYVGKKYRESIGNQVMEVVKISVHWTGNQVTCSYDKGWTTWLPESSLEKVESPR